MGHAESHALLLGAPVEREQQRRRDRLARARDEHGRGPERGHRDRIDGDARLGHRGGACLERAAQPVARVGLGAHGSQPGAAGGPAAAEQRALLVDDCGAHPRHADVDAERGGHTGSNVVRSVWVCPLSAAR